MRDHSVGIPATSETDADRTNLGRAALGFLLWRASLAWTRTATAALEQHGLTHAQWSFLGKLWSLVHTVGPPTQRELADEVGTEARMTSDVLATLERRRLVERQRDPDDGRKIRVSLTPEGDRLAYDALETIQRAERAFFADVDHASARSVLWPLAGFEGSP